VNATNDEMRAILRVVDQLDGQSLVRTVRSLLQA
jgi:hypothetical protein